MKNEPDPLEGRIRLGCGMVFGFVVYLALLLSGEIQHETLLVILVVALPLGCALLAHRLGDRFWFGMARLLRNTFRW